MEMIEFLNKVLPSSGWRATWTIFGTMPKQIWRTDNESLSEVIKNLDLSHGKDVYFSCASFKEKGSRKATNALAARSFWLDIDCGENKDYPSQREGAQALTKFIKESGFPVPMIVSSGNGLHVYWPMTQDVPANLWRKVADILKPAIDAAGLKADPARTADIASVLRPVGSHHRKGEPKVVKLLKDGEPTDFKEFAEKVAALAKKYRVKPVQRHQPKAKPVDPLNAAMAVSQEYPEANAEIVADNCGQIGHLRLNKGNYEEPLWYAGLGVVLHCTDGRQVAHEWSKGYSGYSEKETDRKLEQLAQVGPSTCARFQGINDSYCHGCIHKNRITSPIQLGVKVEREAAPVTERGFQLPDPPKPFKRAKDGLYVKVDDHDHKFYDNDLYPEKIVFDEKHGYEEAIVKHKKPIEGWTEFRIRLGNIVDLRKLSEILLDNGVIVPADGDRKIMSQYIAHYIRELQKQAATLQLFSSMGWKDHNTKFVLGDTIYDHEGDKYKVGLSSNINSDTATGFSHRGDLAEWVALTRRLDEEGMEAHAFTLLCGFGAPLMKFTGLEGALVNVLGTSGTGKSTMQRMINSIWGDYRRLAQSHEDTDNSKFAKAGLFSNLPVTIDEITNIDSMQLSSFVYRITQGRDKNRLNRNGDERHAPNSWNTIIVSSSNESLVGRLAGAKTNPEAESMRVFEYTAGPTVPFEQGYGKLIGKTIRSHYGLAGVEYVRYLVRRSEHLERDLEALQEKIEGRFGMRPQERYWAAVIACSIYGGMIAKKLGLIEFDVNNLMPWIEKQVRNMRDSVMAARTDPMDLFAQYMLSNLDSRVVMNEMPGQKKSIIANSLVSREPNRELHIREEIHTGKIYVDRTHFNKFVQSRGGDATQIKAEMEATGALNRSCRYYLGKGTGISSPQVWCLEFNAKHPEISGTLQVVHDKDAAKEIAEGL